MFRLFVPEKVHRKPYKKFGGNIAKVSKVSSLSHNTIYKPKFDTYQPEIVYFCDVKFVSCCIATNFK